MTPQSTFMVLAPIAPGRVDDLRALLGAMNARPGAADPGNALVPFGRFERLHFARFVVLEAPAGDDAAAYGMPRSPWPASLAFLGDCDGPADTMLAELARGAGEGLRRIFGHCDVPPGADLQLWMARRLRPSAATYVNRIGRTMRQIREEHALHRALVDHLGGEGAAAGGEGPVGAARPPGRLRRGRARRRAPLPDRPGGRAGRLARPQRPEPRRPPGRPGRARAAPARGVARAGVPAPVPRGARPGHRLPRRSEPCRRAVGARGPRRHQPVHDLRPGEARPLPPHHAERPAAGARLLDAPRLQPRPPRPGRSRSTPPAGSSSTTSGACSSPATTTAASRATWTTSSTRWPGASTSSSATA